jgi:hypothetical protein
MVGTNSTLELFFAYLKQYKFYFSHSFQLLKYVV